jgi:hypothetical protein
MMEKHAIRPLGGAARARGAGLAAHPAGGYLAKGADDSDG